MINRLRLDFTIPTFKERMAFLNKYMESDEFKKKPMTPEELEMCGNYVLWGKDEDGKNSVQRKEIQIETRNKTWSREKEAESLEALLESPTFNENNIIATNVPRPKVVKEVFSRSKALKECPEELKKTFQELFREIDTLDLTLNYYDLEHGKRKKPPREELLARFTDEEKAELKEKSTHLNQFAYLKLRHQLVELRKEQFFLKDTYNPTIKKETAYNYVQIPITRIFDAEVPIFPLGLKYNDQKISQAIFQPLESLIPSSFNEKQLQKISNLYWEKQEQEKQKKIGEFFDFREIEHLYALLSIYEYLEDMLPEASIDSTTNNLMDTFKYYASIADLSDIYKEILELKIKKKKNQDIANYINKKYEKSYTSNYISTIFKQKIIKKIADAAIYHQTIISLIYFPEEFKTCNTCGKTLLKCSDNFVRKERSKDGFTNRCKKCDKEERKKKKGG